MKKLFAMFLAAALLLTGVTALADIGTPDNPVKVTMLMKDMPPSDPANQAYCKALNEALAKKGIYVDFSFVESPAGKYVEAMPLAVLNDAIKADILYYQGNTDKTAALQGFLEDMRPIVEKSENIKKIMYPHDVARLENHPYLLHATPVAVYQPVIRKDWASKLETYDKLIADPTVENYVAFLKEMKEKKLCEYPITMDEGHSRLDSVFGAAFGVSKTLVKNKEGKWIFKHVTDEMKNLLKFYAELYKEGLIDPEYLTTTWDVAENKFYSGKAGMLIGKTGATIDVYDTSMQKANGPESALTVLPPAKSELGQAYAAVDVSKEERGRGINSASDPKVKEAAAAIFDFMASPEGRILDMYGVEGVHYKVEDGKIVPIKDAPAWYGVFYDSMKGLDNLPLKADKPIGEAGLKSLELAEKYYQADNNVVLPSELSANWDAMNNLFKEYAYDVITGKKNTEGDWEAFVKDWNAKGGDKISEALDKLVKE